ncbi:MAG: hypothetical protein A2X49_12250 [Lentisphaerae bacterium GWF2_52_8]|nr:MAG: hypothetical protein A2X49_12250 [Lentisphaerae bacterium GWF2_52_8]
MCARKTAKLDISKVDQNMQIKQADDNGLAWYSADEKPLELVGFNWYHQDKIFRRMPLKTEEPLPEGVEWLAWHCAGGQLRFRSDSSRLMLKAEIRNKELMDHMTQTGSNGFDLYLGGPGPLKYRSSARFKLLETEYNCELFKESRREMRDFVINFPLYNGVNKFAIGLDAGCAIEAPAAWSDKRKIAVYGSSITQGGCASRPGMAYTNILSRDLKMPVYNYGFSGSGRGEPIVAKCLAEIQDVSLFILDYEANCHQPGGLETTLPVFIDILRVKHPVTPILVVSRINYSVNDERLSERREIQHNEVKRRHAAGDKNIYFLDGDCLLERDYDECTVDGVHPNDLGFYRMAKNMAPTIRKIVT